MGALAEDIQFLAGGCRPRPLLKPGTLGGGRTDILRFPFGVAESRRVQTWTLLLRERDWSVFPTRVTYRFGLAAEQAGREPTLWIIYTTPVVD